MNVANWTPIYSVTREWTTYAFLCDRHVAARVASGWSLREVGERPGSLAPNECSSCVAERRGDVVVTFPHAVPPREPRATFLPAEPLVLAADGAGPTLGSRRRKR